MYFLSYLILIYIYKVRYVRIEHSNENIHVQCVEVFNQKANNVCLKSLGKVRKPGGKSFLMVKQEKRSEALIILCSLFFCAKIKHFVRNPTFLLSIYSKKIYL